MREAQNSINMESCIAAGLAGRRVVLLTTRDSVSDWRAYCNSKYRLELVARAVVFMNKRVHVSLVFT